MRPRIYSLRSFDAALGVARLLPRWVAQTFAPLLGRVVIARNLAGRDALRENLSGLTGLTGPALAALCDANVANFSRMLADYFYCASHAASNGAALVTSWTGFEHLAAAREEGRGIVVVTGHLGNWELGGIILAMRGFPISVVTLDEPTTALTAWRDAYRRRLGIKTIAVGPGREFAFVEMIQALRRGECVAMLVDRPYAGTGLPVQMLGRDAEFSTAPALLWQHTGAPVIPAFVVAAENGRYRAIAEPPVPMQAIRENRRAALAMNTQAMASVFESIIRRYPEQWFNYAPVWRPAAAPADPLEIHA